MSYIKGKFKQTIFASDSGYKVGLFRVKETDDQDIETNKTITFTGYFAELKPEDLYKFYGDYIYHDKYGYQFQVKNYEKILPEGKDAIIEFLTSPFVKGCGEKTALQIFDLFGSEALEKIKENKDNLLLIPKISEKKVTSIYNSVKKYFEDDEEIIKLKNMGFTIKETMTLINLYGKKIMEIIDVNIYKLIPLIDFKKLDIIFLKNNEPEDERRIKAAIINAMKELSFANGDLYLNKIEIIEELNNKYQINKDINSYLLELQNNKEIMIINDDYYLMDDYLDEVNNADSLCELLSKAPHQIPNFNKLIASCEDELQIKYNSEQELAIKMALTNNISIITGGPGTGKTTILKGIIKVYALLNKLNETGINQNIALLAPTGRASKKMSESTGLGASTIHRFLKWDKENNIFGINELNKLAYNLIIIDETSMIDNHLLSSLFKGIDLKTQIIFVGDEYQLPSVGPGLVLSDMINANIPHLKLETIYRQSDNSFIPVLAKEIKEVDISNDALIKKDDYSFIPSSPHEIKELLIQIFNKMANKKINYQDVQVLVPMYKGENGIDNLNIILQEIINPQSKNTPEVKIGPLTYRVKDKVLNLVNDPDNNIYNGDIGYIYDIDLTSKSDYLVVDYDHNLVSYKREDLFNITHAYAISIHKSQGSEFDHVIMPITSAYNRMLYNKLLYTGVSRAKKSLIIIGSFKAFNDCVLNNYSYIRKTDLKNKILHNLEH